MMLMFKCILKVLVSKYVGRYTGVLVCYMTCISQPKKLQLKIISIIINITAFFLDDCNFKESYSLFFGTNFASSWHNTYFENVFFLSLIEVGGTLNYDAV